MKTFKAEKTYFFAAKLLAAVGALLVFGCAQPSQNPPPTTSQMAAIRAIDGNGGSAAGSNGWNCPGSPNITLANNIAEGGGVDYLSNNYTACRSTSNASAFQINGTTSSQAICIYPMQAGYNSTQGTYTSTPQLVDSPQCFAISGGTITVQFSAGASINYLLIVDSNYTQQLDSCLSSNAPCPAYSEGFVQ